MASPQKENGNTQIAHELLEAIIRSGLNGTELAIVLLVLRKTYGWSKKEDDISISQFMSYIPSSKPTICKALRNLRLVKILLLVKKGDSLKCSNRYKLNKDYETWQLVKKSKLVKKTKRTSKDFETQLVKKPLHTKETITKESTQKKEHLSFFDILWERYPKKLGRKAAYRHYKATVKTDGDRARIEKALNNYLNNLPSDAQFILHGSTFFNNWEDYEDVTSLTIDKRTPYEKALEELKEREKCQNGKC